MKVAAGVVFLLFAGCSPAECWVDGYWEGDSLSNLQVSAAASRTLVMWNRSEGWNGKQVGNLVEVDSEGGIAALESLPTDLYWSRLVAGDSGHLLLMRDADRDLLVGQRLDDRGDPVGERIDIGPSRGGQGEQAFFDGQQYWVAWSALAPGATSYQVSLARVGLDGQVDEPIILDSNTYSAVTLAPVGNRVWVAWSTSNGVLGVAVSSDGAVVGAKRVLLDNRAMRPTLASRGDQALVVAEAAQPDTILFGRRLGPDGVLGDGFELDLQTELDDVSNNGPRVTSLTPLEGDRGYLLVAQVGGYPFPCEQCELQAYELTPDGSPVSSTPLARLSAETGGATLVGDQLLVAYRATTVDEGDSLVHRTAQSRAWFTTLPVDGEFGAPVLLDHSDYVFDGTKICDTL